MKVNELAGVVNELIEISSMQAKELEQLITHVEQVTARLPDGSEMAVIRSSLAGLHQRLQKLGGVKAKAAL